MTDDARRLIRDPQTGYDVDTLTGITWDPRTGWWWDATAQAWRAAGPAMPTWHAPRGSKVSSGKKALAITGSVVAVLAVVGIIGAALPSSAPNSSKARISPTSSDAPSNVQPTHSAAYLAAQARQARANKRKADAEAALQASRAKAARVAAAAWHQGYHESNTAGVYFKWVDEACSYLSCVKAKFITESGCSSLYVEGNWLNNNEVVGYANDTASNLAPHQVARLEFTDTSDAGHTFHITEVDCY